ncbi:hypothetical protein ACHAXR_009684 [Thalassiosira sp. AJA248-18]
MPPNNARIVSIVRPETAPAGAGGGGITATPPTTKKPSKMKRLIKSVPRPRSGKNKNKNGNISSSAGRALEHGSSDVTAQHSNVVVNAPQTTAAAWPSSTDDALGMSSDALTSDGGGAGNSNNNNNNSDTNNNIFTPPKHHIPAKLSKIGGNSITSGVVGGKSVDEIATILQTESIDLEVRDRKYHLKTYHDCFVGSELVDYLVEHDLALNRVQAVEIGQEIMSSMKVFEHVVTKDRIEFKDDYLFYRFVEYDDDEPVETVPNYRRLSSGGGSGGVVSHGGAVGIIKMDKYGFLLDDDHCVKREDHDNGSVTGSATGSTTNNSHDSKTASIARLRATDAKRWEQILDKVPTSKSFNSHHTNNNNSNNNGNSSSNLVSSQSKVKYYARRGLPDSMRQKAWTVLTGVDLIMNEHPGEYDKLVEKAEEIWNRNNDLENGGDLSASCEGFGSKGPSSAAAAAAKTNNNSKKIGGCGDSDAVSVRVGNLLDTIERDIHRTFPKHYLFHAVKNDNDEDDGGGGSGGGENSGSSSNKLGDSQSTEEIVFDSENIASDDEEDDDDDDDENGEENSTMDDDDAADDITAKAEATGQDAASVVADKKKLFNESMNLQFNESMTSMIDSMRCGASLRNVATKEEEEDDGDPRKSTNSIGDKSLDIFDEEDDDDDTHDHGNSSNNHSSKLGGSRLGSTRSIKSDASSALGIGEGQGALRRVLRAYSMYDSEVGYCQGMNFISAMFLTFLSEEEAFWLLVVVMNEEPYKLRELFGEDMAGTHEVLYIAEKLLAQFLPRLSKHMEEESIHVSMFVTQWLLTLYTSTFPFELVARVWDSFLVEGWKVVYRVMLSLLERASKDVLDMRFEDILHYFREFPSSVNGQEIMAGSLKISLKRKHIQKHVNEWRRHAGGGGGPSGEERTKRRFRSKRRPSDDSSVSSNTLNSSDRHTMRTIIAQPKHFLKKKEGVPKEIVIENLSEQLIPIVGTNKFAVMLHNVLTPEECSELIDQAEESGFEDASIYDRRTNRVHRNCVRYITEDLDLADTWFERIVDALKDTMYETKLTNAPWVKTPENRNSGKVLCAVGLNERLRLLRYSKDQFFHSHNDASFVRGQDQGERAGEKSCVSVHVYLNQKFKGGSTRFWGGGRHLDVKPRSGSVLIFEHNLLHEGRGVTHGKKYIVRTDVMYSMKSAGFTSDASGTTLTQQL